MYLNMKKPGTSRAEYPMQLIVSWSAHVYSFEKPSASWDKVKLLEFSPTSMLVRMEIVK